MEGPDPSREALTRAPGGREAAGDPSPDGRGAWAPPANPWGRFLNRVTVALLLLGALGVLALAAIVRPDPSGMGTHTRLGLKPCGILVLTGRPCPSCGMTTSFAEAAHLHPLAAARVQPMGFLLFLLTVAFVVVAPVIIWRGDSPFDLVSERVLRWGLLLFTGGVIVAWIYKLLVTPLSPVPRF